jgi:pimeloyl-ACP methyl ester carboxylesterase
MSPVDSGLLDVEGASLYYEVFGAGSPVVLLQGTSVDHRVWDEQVAPLAHAHTIVRYDLRGSGRSTAGAGGTHLDDLKALLDHLGFQRSVLLGQALGARIAVDFAVTYPEAVRALILVDLSLEGLASDRLAVVAAPALVAVGERAGEDAHQRASTLEAALPDAWKVVVPGAGRLINQEAPQRFNEIVMAFLAETERKSRR